MPDVVGGRLAFREVGGFEHAYWALPHTMEGAVPLGSIPVPAWDKAKHRDAFIALMREVVAELIVEKTGMRPRFEKPREPELQADAPPHWTDAERRALSKNLQTLSRWVEQKLKSLVGGKLAFSLIIWGKFGPDQMIQYVSNANRADCAKYMKDLLAGWEAGMPDIPFHERQ